MQSGSICPSTPKATRATSYSSYESESLPQSTRGARAPCRVVRSARLRPGEPRCCHGGSGRRSSRAPRPSRASRRPALLAPLQQHLAASCAITTSLIMAAARGGRSRPVRHALPAPRQPGSTAPRASRPRCREAIAAAAGACAPAPPAERRAPQLEGLHPPTHCSQPMAQGLHPPTSRGKQGLDPLTNRGKRDLQALRPTNCCKQQSLQRLRPSDCEQAPRVPRLAEKRVAEERVNHSCPEPKMRPNPQVDCVLRRYAGPDLDAQGASAALPWSRYPVALVHWSASQARARGLCA